MRQAALILKSGKGLWRDTRGSTALEMSVLLIPFLVVVFGIIEISRLYFSQHELVVLAENLSRQIILNDAGTELTNWLELVTGSTILIDPSEVQLVQTITVVSDVTYHKLQLSYSYHYLVPIIGNGIETITYQRTIPVTGF